MEPSIERAPSLFASRDGWVKGELVGLSQEDRLNHLLIIGKTKSGKTTLMHNLMLQDINAGRGLCFIDPHGDEASDLLNLIPSWRFNQVVYIDPAGEREYPISLNPLVSVPPDDRHLVAERVYSIFKAIWRLSPEKQPRLPRTLYNIIRALLDLPPRCGATLLGVPRMVVDQAYREWVVSHIQDPACRAYWREEIAAKDNDELQAIFDPVMSRVGAFLQSPQLRLMLGQSTRKFNPRFLMDHSRIVICNLRKGRLGPEAAHLVGALLVSEFENAAYSREDMPLERRVPFYLYADEFQNYVTESFSSSLSEVRKYGLGLTLGHQYTAQVPEEMLSAILGNVGSLIAFRVGEEDAPLLSAQFNPFPPTRLLELGKYEVACRLLHDGQTTDAIAAVTLPPFEQSEPGFIRGSRQTVLSRSRRHYARPRRVVEKKIERWMEREGKG